MKLAIAAPASRTIPSPIGPLRIAARGGALVRLDMLAPPSEDELALFAARPEKATRSELKVRKTAAAQGALPLQKGGAEEERVLDRAERELREFFAGKRRAFTIPLAPEGTEFQQAVWKALLEIPCGETRSYADIARAIGKPGASRAVGAANGANPIAVIVPCHRVIASGGGLGGYGGGLPCKRRLLAIERGGAKG